jgi:glycosyltransferase involved in cell wall biosynthesis
MSKRADRVSVCVATYQGERFVAAQLQSILTQLSDGDEVIIVDDHSMDTTCERIVALGDSRIRLIRHDANRGVAESFEEAISQASGDVIFLSDQDD